MSKNPWSLSIAELHADAERCARRLRSWALALSFLTLAAFVTVFWFCYQNRSPQNLGWAITSLSGLTLAGAFLLLTTRTLWNYSNVWLGRAGTLEDLTIALRLLRREPDDSEFAESCKSLIKGERIDAEKLKAVVEALALLRRDFEGQLLAGSPFEQPKKPEIKEQ